MRGTGLSNSRNSVERSCAGSLTRRDYVTRIEKKIVLIDGEKLDEDYFEQD